MTLLKSQQTYEASSDTIQAISLMEPLFDLGYVCNLGSKEVYLCATLGAKLYSLVTQVFNCEREISAKIWVSFYF
jgi:hypothetical protein